MPIKAILKWEDLVTSTALVWFLSNVCSCMYSFKGTNYYPEGWFGFKNDFFGSLLFSDLNDLLSPPKAKKVKKIEYEGVQMNLKGPYILILPMFFLIIFEKTRFSVKLDFFMIMSGHIWLHLVRFWLWGCTIIFQYRSSFLQSYNIL